MFDSEVDVAILSKGKRQLERREEFSVGDPVAPVYIVADVARYTQLRAGTARNWIQWIPGRVSIGEISLGLSFLDLVSLLVMRQLRHLGISPQRIKLAEAYLTGRLGPYPLARNVVWTDGGHILFNPQSPLALEVPKEALESADLWGQRAFVQIIHQYLHRITYSEEGLAISWSPVDRVELSPSRQFGQPCVEGTRVRTHSIYLFHKAGEPVDAIAVSLAISPKDVEAALRWEIRLEELAV